MRRAGALALLVAALLIFDRPAGEAIPRARLRTIAQPAWRPILHCGFTAGRPVAAWAVREGVAVTPLDSPGAAPVLIPGLRAAMGWIPLPDGALVLGLDELVELDADARTRARAKLEGVAPSPFMAAAWNGRAVVLVVAERSAASRLVARVHDRAGRLLGPPVELARGQGLLGELHCAPLDDGLVAVAWVDTVPSPHVRAAVLDGAGRAVVAPFELHEPGRGTVGDVVLVAGGKGRALAAWMHSRTGPWALRARLFDAQGKTRSDWARTASTDLLRPHVALGPRGPVLAWIRGLHWGLFARTGAGEVRIQDAGASAPGHLIDSSGSIESFDFAIHGDRMAVVALVEEAGKPRIEAGVLNAE